jgi:hypothetical protein
MPAEISHNGFDEVIIRDVFKCKNGHTVSIQQSSVHYCDKDSVEMWLCKHHEMLRPYGTGRDPYTKVPFQVAVDYLNWLETLPQKGTFQNYEQSPEDYEPNPYDGTYSED